MPSLWLASGTGVPVSAGAAPGPATSEAAAHSAAASPTIRTNRVRLVVRMLDIGVPFLAAAAAYSAIEKRLGDGPPRIGSRTLAADLAAAPTFHQLEIHHEPGDARRRGGDMSCAQRQTPNRWRSTRATSCMCAPPGSRHRSPMRWRLRRCEITVAELGDDVCQNPHEHPPARTCAVSAKI